MNVITLPWNSFLNDHYSRAIIEHFLSGLPFYISQAGSSVKLLSLNKKVWTKDSIPPIQGPINELFLEKE